MADFSTWDRENLEAVANDMLRKIIADQSDQVADLSSCKRFINAAEDKRKRDIESIRFAMQQLFESTDTFSTIADPIDEARLDGMRRMLTVFDVTVLQCKSR
jgi:hypothetical protein